MKKLSPVSEALWKYIKPIATHYRIHLVPPTGSSMTTMRSNVSIDKNPDTEQIGGRHYKKLAIQPWDYVIANDLDYFQGSIIKYVTRWKDKGWTEDLHKAKHFLDKYIVTMEEKYKGLKQRDIEDGNPNPNR